MLLDEWMLPLADQDRLCIRMLIIYFRILISLLLQPCVADADIIFFILFLLSSFFFPHLISAVADWMSTILLHSLACRSEMCCAWLAGNAGPKNSSKIHHLGTIAQLCRAMSLQLRHLLSIGKKTC